MCLLAKEINDIADILADDKLVDGILKVMLRTMEDNGRDRETQLMAAVEDINLEDTIVDEDAVVTITHKGLLSGLWSNT